MITEKQKEAVKELCQYVDNFCKENNLSVFMSVVASEDVRTGLSRQSAQSLPARLNILSALFQGLSKRIRMPIRCFPWHSCRPTRERLTLILFRSVEI